MLIGRVDGYSCSSFKPYSDFPCTEGQIPALVARSPSVYQSHPMHIWCFLNINVFTDLSPHPKPQIRRTSRSLIVWVITFDLSSMRDLASSCSTAGLAFRVFWLRQPNFYVKAGIPSAGWAGVDERKSLCTQRIRTRNRPARSETLYRISYPDPRLS